MKLIKKGNEEFTHDRSAFYVILNSLRGLLLLANINVPDVLRFPRVGKYDVISKTEFFVSFSPIKVQFRPNNANSS